MSDEPIDVPSEVEASQELQAPPQAPVDAESLPTAPDPDLVNVTERGVRPSEREVRLAGRLEP